MKYQIGESAYRQLVSQIGEPSARYVLNQVAPVLQILAKNDDLIKANKKLLNNAKVARKSAKRAQRKQREYAQKLNGTYRRPISDTGYSNGHDMLTSYSPYPKWHHPGGRSSG